jgi:hypothetical protein
VNWALNVNTTAADAEAVLKEQFEAQQPDPDQDVQEYVDASIAFISTFLSSSGDDGLFQIAMSGSNSQDGRPHCTVQVVPLTVDTPSAPSKPGKPKG